MPDTALANRPKSDRRANFYLVIKNVAIIHKNDKPEAAEFSQKAASWFGKQGIKVFSPSDIFVKGTEKLSSSKDYDKIDLVLVLGGDGTYLNAAHRISGRKIPIMGANFGNVGFLAETEARHVLDRLKLVIAGKLTSVSRFVMNVAVKQGKKTLYDSLALNDVVVERGGNTHLIDLEAFCDDSLVSRFRGDGLIISTPTGSTAYNLSAGGPIIHPEVSALAVTPVCPHSLNARPIILADHHKITVRLVRDQDASLMVDGVFGIGLKSGMDVVMEKSKNFHHMITSGEDYFELLNKKLEFGHRN
jgi:NAD+ kinase